MQLFSKTKSSSENLIRYFGRFCKYKYGLLVPTCMMEQCNTLCYLNHSKTENRITFSIKQATYYGELLLSEKSTHFVWGGISLCMELMFFFLDTKIVPIVKVACIEK